MTPLNLSASSINGTSVVNNQGENLGNIKELMIDTNSGQISYVVLSFGGFLGLGDKYFAMPWEAFTIDTDKEEFILNVSKEKLEDAPGFDKDAWPTNADHTYLNSVYEHYGYAPYWDKIHV
ncbi:MAG: PRC-barrel domain containing protein [Cyclobacteriaceae bacterium]|nr:PRC-barrel domain containing protein [Cyclobacteriaceae bacterium]